MIQAKQNYNKKKPKIQFFTEIPRFRQLKTAISINNLELSLINCVKQSQIPRLIQIIPITNERIRTLNQKYRNKDQVTDVLSFSYQNSDQIFQQLNISTANEIFLAPDFIKQQSLKHKQSFADLTIRVIIHGLMHVCGYTHNHSQDFHQMQKVEKYMLKSYYNLYSGD
ncbi:MAG: rRNA maturation RNase YbeY [Candidatus Moranbacteria bacterium]|nr:rRNA maturation RNase YbeY [Candidatus Moranbacteria bacterium]